MFKKMKTPQGRPRINREASQLPGAPTGQHQHASSDTKQLDKYLTEALRRIESLEAENRTILGKLKMLDTRIAGFAAIMCRHDEFDDFRKSSSRRLERVEAQAHTKYRADGD